MTAIREAGAPCRDCGGPTVWISDAWTTCPSCVTRSREELFRALRVGSHAGAIDRIRALLADREQREEEIARLREALEGLLGEMESWRDIELREQTKRGDDAADVLRVVINAIRSRIAPAALAVALKEETR